MRTVYLDNAATTPLRKEVIHSMSEVLSENFGNPSSTHSYGRKSKSLVESSRKEIASCFNASASEIIFTSGGTEADNLVLRSAVKDLGIKRIITSRIEHHAVLHTAEAITAEFGIKLEFVNLDNRGGIDLSHLEELLNDELKTLVSVMHVNNEIGNLTDLKTVAELCKQKGALFHSDCVQSVGHFELDVKSIPIDFFAASAHKFNGPKGVGFCFIRKDSGLRPLIIGGEQERGFRAGTESVHNIVGMEQALSLAYQNLEQERKHIEGLKRYFIERLQTELPEVEYNGYSDDFDRSTYTLVSLRLPVPPEQSDMILFQLDLKGIACSKGSACQSGSNAGSHVLNQVLSPEQLLKPSLRFSFGIFNTREDIDYTISVLKELVQVSA